MNEFDRRKAIIAARQTDVERWSDRAQLEAVWEPRAAAAAQLLPMGVRVADIGCGAMALETYLPYGCTYVPCDLVSRDQRTVVVDLNANRLPTSLLDSVDVVVMLGVWEYIYEPEQVFSSLKHRRCPVITSYCSSELTKHLDRRSLGWVNDFTIDDFVRLAAANGYRVAFRQQMDDTQYLLKLVPDVVEGTVAPKKVHVASYFNTQNFGDRLGFHVLSQVLPSNAEVSWGTLEPFSEVKSGTDLFIVGIGNSLYGNLLSNELIAAAQRAKSAIGIFGTQYREDLPRDALDRLLGNLTHWYARSQDDVYLYGRHSSVSHLGDWLINLFPMTHWVEDKSITIPAESVRMDVSIDRFIQFIQRHRRVLSYRLHPLLCALTSAEEVGFVEQREIVGKSTASGKFRSLLMDIFDRSFAEKSIWNVDRLKVLRYKDQVARNTEAMRTKIASLLS